MANTNDKTDALLAQLDGYLQGCPDPNKVWPKWMVRKASRLLWACREALAAQPAEGGEAVKWELRVVDKKTGSIHYDWRDCSQAEFDVGSTEGSTLRVEYRALYTTPQPVEGVDVDSIMEVVENYAGKHSSTSRYIRQDLAKLIDSAGGAKCGCGLATCVEPWEPGCGLGTSEEHVVVDAEGEQDWRIGMFDRWNNRAKELGFAGIAEAIDSAGRAKGDMTDCGHSKYEPCHNCEPAEASPPAEGDCPRCGCVDDGECLCPTQPAEGDGAVEMRARHEGSGLLALYNGDKQIREIGITPGWHFKDRDEFIFRYNNYTRPATTAVVPDGWKLVPIVATPSMDAAGKKALSDNGVADVHDADALVCFAAMLAAAPATGEQL